MLNTYLSTKNQTCSPCLSTKVLMELKAISTAARQNHHWSWCFGGCVTLGFKKNMPCFFGVHSSQTPKGEKVKLVEKPFFFWRKNRLNSVRNSPTQSWKLAKWSCSRNGAALKRIYPKQLEPENPKNPECDSFSANKQPYKMEGCRLSFCGISHHVHPFVDLIDGKKLSAVLREGLSCSAKMKIRISRHKNDETYFWIPRSQFSDL